MTSHRPVRLGDVTFDPSTGELLRAGVLRRLRPQSAAVFSLLLARRGQLVTRRELTEAVWGRSSWSADQGLNACIRDVRRALADDHARPRYVETIPRRGYRIIEQDAAPSGARRPVWPRAAAAAAVVAIMGAAAAHLVRSPERQFIDPEVLHAFGELRTEPGERAMHRARGVLADVLEAAPHSASAHAEAAYLDFRTGLRRSARAHSARALALDPLDIVGHVTAGAIALYWDADVRGAERHLEIARSLDPQHPRVLLADAFFAAATGDIVSARAHATRLTGRPGRTATDLVEAGYLRYAVGDYEGMERDCASAEGTSARRTEARRCRILARVALGDEAGAADLARKLVRAPTSLSDNEVTRRFWARELAGARRALRRDQRTGAAHVQAARALAHLGDAEAARRALSQARRTRSVAAVHGTDTPALASLKRVARRPGSVADSRSGLD